MEKDLICRFTEILGQLKALHWQTESYARHIAYDKAHGALSGLIDEFIESYQGRYKRIKITGQPTLLNVNEDINGFIDGNINFLTTELPAMISQRDCDLYAIRDEMVQELNTLKFLLTLK